MSANYEVLILRRAQKELGRLESEHYRRIVAFIAGLSAEPRPKGCKKLVGRDAWRIRVGSYRVIFEIDDDAASVLIVHIGHRRDVYASR